MAKKNYDELAKQVVALVGTAENISYCTHCVTRLRFELKDHSRVDVENIKALPGVIGAQWSGEQFQIIIGQDVPKVYACLCEKAGLAIQTPVEENLDEGLGKEPFSLKKWGNSIFAALSGCVAPLIPVLMVAGMLKMVTSLFGDLLGILPVESDLYRVLALAGNAGFYFFPVMIGYTGAKKFGGSPILGILMGGILLHPDLITIAVAGDPFTVFGIPMVAGDYASSVLPMILITWVMSYVEKFLKKHIPDVLSTIFVPLITVLVMLPVGLCLLAPIGTILSNYIMDFLNWIYAVFGGFGVAIIAGLYPFLIMAGMHLPVITTVIMAVNTVGYEAVIYPGAAASIYSGIALCLTYAIKAKNAADRSLGISCLASQALGGVGEPMLFGIVLCNKKAMLFSLLGTLAGGLTAGLTGAKCYMLAPSNLIQVLAYGQDMVKGGIACAVAFAVTFVLCMMFGFEDTSVVKK